MYNKKVLRNYGYQSQENILYYYIDGINKRKDNIRLWNDAHRKIY